ncbi:5-formyltetrahydrofolate cyclo-ligase [Amycolatopsis rubida]|uniref:5-formyltetrahydrofolate cyclo-ligase n=1 Tax=Amycolatopsis rubida TaxID=112413 RepID=A0ABX0BZ44_9PSEU|nr:MULTISPECIES: 5-formyltetrahydrofolate cyclo-ligase [Amycolatopsis]MYW95766.1 5-formyltetrahydrofolate cyclo-ligase [Amycolatopsis rubida]NEC60756.1 5-formyltetrahydrofolate cyclo-ligase [Amycolatopsis rubida]OAP19956.1 5-formyltetrahydrofolate cyclo-ligase family protein [Amycolatopsis sp. M39]
MQIDEAKRAARERVWALLDAEAVDPKGAAGRIPSFTGAEAAAQRLAALDVWRDARVLKSNPDRAQLPVREAALRDGKTVYMAVPAMASPDPFYALDPAKVGVEAARSKYAAGVAPTVGPGRMEPIDLVVCGTVAVDRRGARVGKGGGYSDLEIALLTEAGLIGPRTTIVTTVHELQVVDADLPETDHDFSVDIIVTPDQVIYCEARTRPAGIVWNHLSREKIRAIPALSAHAEAQYPDDRSEEKT